MAFKWGLNLGMFNTAKYGKIVGVPLNLLSSVYTCTVYVYI